MNRREMLSRMGAAGLLLQAAASGAQTTPAEDDTVYELRIYHTFPGKLDGLMARFRDHTITIFRRHGIESVAY
ncbi:MAG: NIPSNAP family protein [Acidobacteriota bacterium]|nr:NIPSNAP family protein [Acidobacteriota bacterium]